MSWLRLHRQLIDSNCAESDELLGLFVRLLLKANYKAKSFKDLTINPGQLVFAWRLLGERLYCKNPPSINTLRARVGLLQKLKAIQVEPHPSGKFSVLTIVNWPKYQRRSVSKSDTPNAETPVNVSKSDTQLDTLVDTLVDTEIRKERRKRNTDTHSRSLFVECPQGLEPTIWQDWLMVRKSKRLCKPTKTVMTRLEREAAKARLTLAQAITESAERGWGGFEAAWLTDKAVGQSESGRADCSKFNGYRDQVAK